MNEVENMYSNAGIKKINTQYANNITYHLVKYPPFTAEKQLELIKWLGTTEYYTFGIFYHQGLWYIFTETMNRNDKKFDECLAKLINYLWQSLTDAERKQIKNILESEVRE